MEKPSRIILGIDPGTLLMGYGLIAIAGNKVSLIDMGVLKLSSKNDPHERLRLIHKKVNELILQFRPHDFAIEAPFFGKNVQSMLKLGRAQGVAIATAMQASIPVTEYSPKKIKQSITGNGNADKEQVWKMLQQILQVKNELKHYDASDALAVAVCHHFQNGTVADRSSKKLNSWFEFVKKNPERVRKASGRNK
ncbi:MAG TPA: crossover junction endodeoxyribonuclease RuvC [Puia sp.]|nr:crossover junction endodeoxyribonuclease RuvC [Puia sp.]